MHRFMVAVALALGALQGSAAAKKPFHASWVLGRWEGTWQHEGTAGTFQAVVGHDASGMLHLALDVDGPILGCGDPDPLVFEFASGADWSKKKGIKAVLAGASGEVSVRLDLKRKLKVDAPASCAGTGPAWKLRAKLGKGTLNGTIEFAEGSGLAPVELSAARGAPTGQVRNNLVILADFPGAKSALSHKEIDQFWNADGFHRKGAARSGRDWFAEVSSGRLDVVSTVTPWITLPHPADHYQAQGSIDGPDLLVRDAIAALDATGFDFAPFDGDGDGFTEGVGVLYRGPAPKFGSGDGPGWTQAPGLDPGVAVDGVTIHRTWIMPDWFPAFGSKIDLGAVQHEMGWHALAGMPDLMPAFPGLWASAGIENPTQWAPLAKLKLGLVDVIDVDASDTPIRLAPVQLQPQVVRLWIDPYREHEYFLLENRARIGADADLPGAGLLIWHVDEMGADDAYLRLEQADGLDELGAPYDGSGFGAADAGDPYPGSTGSTAFTGDTTPSSAARDGMPTGVRVEDIAMDGLDVVARVTPSPNLAGFSLVYDELYPSSSHLWSPPQGNAVGERVAVRFTSPQAALVRRARFSIVLPGSHGFTLRVHDDFDAQLQLSGTPRAEVSGTAAGDFAWTTVTFDPALPVAAGETLVVELELADPCVTVDLHGKPSGRSFYRAPGQPAFAPIPYDLRLRLNLQVP